MDRVEIPLSKTRITLVVGGALAFMVIGVLFMVKPETFVSPLFRNPFILRVMGIVAVLFFGFAGLYGVRKLFDKEIGLVLDDRGITDNTNASSVGLIEWADITAIETEQVMSTRFLLIYTTQPEKYLDRVGGFKRKLLQGNMKMYGTPLSITSTTIRYDFDALEELVKARLRLHQEKDRASSNIDF